MMPLFSLQRSHDRLPRSTRWYPALLLAALARRRRALGRYDMRTLALFRTVARRTNTASAFLDYVLFRRDLGYPLKRHWVESLRRGRERLGESAQYRLMGMLVEIGVDPDFAGGERKHGARIPAVAWRALDAGYETNSEVARISRMQEEWRAEFARLLRSRVDAGLCVVGNAGALRGSVMGERIDRHALVVRFNRFRAADSRVQDVGEKLDVWCMAPGFRDAAPNRVEWVVVTGPDMQFRLQDWGRVLPLFHSGSRVLTVPLDVWRTLVAELMAPPSAGVLTLAWIRTLLGSWRGVSATGFGVSETEDVRYHHADPRQKAIQRHDWRREFQLLHRWRGEGLEWMALKNQDSAAQDATT